MPWHQMIRSFKGSMCFALIISEARVGIIWLTFTFDFEIASTFFQLQYNTGLVGRHPSSGSQYIFNKVPEKAFNSVWNYSNKGLKNTY